MIGNIIIVSVVGAFLCLDRVFLLLMISRPIVVGCVIGFILGDTFTGLIAGAFTELFWIDRLPIGMYQPPNDTITAILIAASSIETGRILGTLPQGLIALSVLFFVPFGLLAQKMDILIIKWNGKLTADFIRDLKNGELHSIIRLHFSPLVRTWILSVCFIMATLFVGVNLLAWIYPLLPGWSTRGLTLLYPMLPLVGTAVALNAVHVRGALPVFSGVFILGTILFHYIKMGV